MKLYYSPGACSLASHIVAAEGGLKLELEKVDLKTHKTQSGEDFYAINPKGYVPALALDDGSLLTENVALLSFLGDRTGAHAAAPDRYRLLEWLGFISTELHKSFGPLFHKASSDDASKAVEKIRSRFGFVEDRMKGDFLFGAAFSPADAYLYVMLRWAEKFEINMGNFPKLRAYKHRMETRTGVIAALKAEGLA